MTYIVSGGALNSIYSLTHSLTLMERTALLRLHSREKGGKGPEESEK